MPLIKFLFLIILITIVVVLLIQGLILGIIINQRCTKKVKNRNDTKETNAVNSEALDRLENQRTDNQGTENQRKANSELAEPKKKSYQRYRGSEYFNRY
jgi:hypothetical protein